MTVERGLHASIGRTVGPEDTAAALGSGDLAVLATPRLLAWFEAATQVAIEGRLTAGQSTVGTRVSVEHLRASAVGTPLRIDAEVGHVDGRLLRFDVVAEDSEGVVVARGQVTRVVVERERFLARL